MLLLRCQVLLLATCVALSAGQSSDKYTDENRPYEFGFTIDGEQHRHEKKDEKGIIMGEFGFITADGVYHVTVYATDENGDFKIISMKNTKIGPPLDQPHTGPAPRYEPGPPSPSQITTLRPVTVQQGSRQPVAPQGTPPRQPIAPQGTPPRQPIAPQGTPPRQLIAPLVTTSRPVSSTVNGCSSCKVVITTPKPLPLPPGATPAINQVYPPAGILTSPAVTGFKPDQGIIAPAGVLPGGIKPVQPGITRPGSVLPGDVTLPGAVFPGSTPPGRFNPTGPINTPGRGNQLTPFGQPPSGITPFTPGLNGKHTPGGIPNTGTDPPEYRPDDIFPVPIAPGIKPGFPPTNSVSNGIIQNLPGITRTPGVIPPTKSGFEDNSVSRPFNPPGKSLTPPFREPGKTISEVPIGTVQDGLPKGVRMQDIMDLLYKFNYTTGFHGHHESGYRNGDKIGDYFANGRDGYARQVNYVANEFGYQPNITKVWLGLDSPETPKKDTEKDYGLKGYEFKWYYLKK